MRMFQALHKYYDDCFSNGEFDRDKVIENGLIDNNYNTEERLKLLERVYKIVLEAKFINDFTLDYLTHSNRNYDDIIKKYNENNDEPIDLNTGRSRITFCQRKIAEVFTTVRYRGEDLNFITWLFFYDAHTGLENNADKIDLRNEFIRQFNRFNDIYGEVADINKKDMLITIPTFDKVSELSEEKFNDFMEIIQPYSKHMLAAVQSEVNNMVEEVGYFRYLMSKSSKLSEVDIERKNTLLRWLGRETISNEPIIENNSSNNETYSGEEERKIITDIGSIF